MKTTFSNPNTKLITDVTSGQPDAMAPLIENLRKSVRPQKVKADAKVTTK